MNPKQMLAGRYWRTLLVMLCAFSLGVGDAVALASVQQPAAPAAAPTDYVYSPDQLDSLVAPIALYPDPLLAQTLAASTYPLELVQLQQWLAKNSDLKEKKLAEKVAKQPWDPSIQAMAMLPNVVKRLADDIQWTTELGNAFLAQEADVMQAVQRMRVKAQSTGQLRSTPEQVVKTEVIESRNVVVIEQANPQVVYVPSYNPVVVYGAPVYPYPPIYYPPYGAYAAGAAISFGVGVAMGAAWGGGWGWNAGWGHNDINVNWNNNFNRNANINRNVAGNRWQHQPQHRGGTPYQNRATANRYGGAARGDSMASRQAARQSARPVGTSGVAGQAGAARDRASQAGSAARDRASQAGSAARDRASQAGAAARDRGANASSRAAGAGDRIGQRDVPRANGGRESAFGGSDRFSGSSARERSSRGSSSFGSRGGGGFSRGGGGFSRGGGGGFRGGGGSRGGGRR